MGSQASHQNFGKRQQHFTKNSRAKKNTIWTTYLTEKSKKYGICFTCITTRFQKVFLVLNACSPVLPAKIFAFLCVKRLWNRSDFSCFLQCFVWSYFFSNNFRLFHEITIWRHAQIFISFKSLYLSLLPANRSWNGLPLLCFFPCTIF